MELTQLNYFCAVAKSTSMAMAAEILNVSQSTLSLSIKALEEELGVVLFEKRGRRKELSQAGQLFLEHLEPLLNGLDELKDMMQFAENQNSPTITVAIEAVGFATELILSYRSLHPEVDILQIRPTRKNARSLLLLGRADLCIGLFDDSSYELESKLILTDHFKLLIHTTHPLASQDTIAMKDIAHETLVCLTRDYALRQLVEQYYRQAGIRPHRVFEVGDAETIPIPIKNANGVTFISEYHYETAQYINSQGIVGEHWSPFDPIGSVARTIGDVNCIQNIYVTTHRKAQRSKVCQDFLAFAEQYAQETATLGYFPTHKYRNFSISPFKLSSPVDTKSNVYEHERL